MNLTELRDAIHNWAKGKGWYDTPASELDFIAKSVANIHGETSELWEAARKGQLHEPCDKDCGLTCLEEEMADIIIRVLDSAGHMNVDIERAVNLKRAYNDNRPHRHGGKLA